MIQNKIKITTCAKCEKSSIMYCSYARKKCDRVLSLQI